MNNFKIIGLGIMLAQYSCFTKKDIDTSKPNIIIILADDLGHGDVEILNKNSLIPTPNLNKLANEGLIFTDAHTSSAVCTPSRYSLMTGRYCWRSRLTSGVLYHYAGTLIEEGRETVAEMLKREGYFTGMAGKWHLGIDWKLHDESARQLMATDPLYSDYKNIDFSSAFTKGINDYGFDYSFAWTGSAEMNPSTYLENNRVTAIPVYSSEEIRKKRGEWYGRDDNNIAEGIYLEDLVPAFSRKACEFIEKAVKSHPEKPFFLYYPLTSPHNPVIPNSEFIGKSKAGAYGDFVVELDFHVGKILEKLDELGITKNTMVIFTSDNGPVDRTRGYQKRWVRGDVHIHGHSSNAPFRGWKTQLFEGGHRVPFFVRWPEMIKAGDICNTTICLNDIFPTFAEMLKTRINNQTAEDGVSFFPALTGRNRPASFHEAIIHHSVDGQFAIRKKNYKLIINGPKTPSQLMDESVPATFSLFDLANDLKEINDLSENHPDIVKEMHALIKKYIKEGRSR